MKRILGLDLGTTSIGWALVNEAELLEESSSIIALGVRTVPLTTDEQDCFEKGKSISTNADRRLKRGMRRNLDRYKLRRRALIGCLIRHGFIRSQEELVQPGSSLALWELRAKAATEEISLKELARVLFMLNKKRGYKSNRKTDNKTKDGQAIDSIDVSQTLNAEGLVYPVLVEVGSRLPCVHLSSLYSILSVDEVRMFILPGDWQLDMETVLESVESSIS